MDYPTLSEVAKAGPDKLLRWTRFLPSPGGYALSAYCAGQTTYADAEEARKEEAEILDVILAKQRALGGITPGSSKRVGWDKP